MTIGGGSTAARSHPIIFIRPAMEPRTSGRTTSKSDAQVLES